MLFTFLEEFVVFLEAALVLLHPLAGEFTRLDFSQDLLHLLLGVLVDDTRTAGDVAILSGLRDLETHSSDT